MKNERPAISMIIGPTAAGKSAMAEAVALMKGAEVVNADSMQVYRGMDIGTAKPSPVERGRVVHHLIDLRDPWERFSTADFVRLADETIAGISARGRGVLVVGGTALYLRSLLLGIFDGPSADWQWRRELREEALIVGSEELHRRLAAVDPEAAARIHPNDLRRIERALEINAKTGERPSALRNQWKAGESRYNAKIAGIAWPREELKKRIDIRVDGMMRAGWLDEVRRLLADARGLGREASQALGYKELARVVSGELDIESAVAEIRKRTHRFAKAQMTWFKTFPDVKWFDGQAIEEGKVSVTEVARALGLP